jgi:hypothetical protein
MTPRTNFVKPTQDRGIGAAKARRDLIVLGLPLYLAALLHSPYLTLTPDEIDDKLPLLFPQGSGRRPPLGRT